MKTLEFIYQETQIHFLINPTDDNVMVNATEMAKLFNKRTDVYLKSRSTKDFINALKLPPNGGSSDMNIIDFKGRNGIYFHRILALDFAAWLDVNFRVWVFTTIERITFGYLKDYRDAMLEELEAKNRKDSLKAKLVANPSQETVKAYFDNEAVLNSAKAKKRKATTNQLSLFQENKKPEAVTSGS